LNKKNSLAAISGAAFLMATSAIGPGFINNTVLFTGQLAASFGFVILVSVVLDVLAQLNLWRIITIRGLYAQQIAGEQSRAAAVNYTGGRRRAHV
jgi:Mn2+/Fe2+ NRAMP family transporter